MKRKNRDHPQPQPDPPRTPPTAPESAPLISLRALVILAIAVGAGLLVADHPAIAVPVGIGVTILGVLYTITS